MITAMVAHLHRRYLLRLPSGLIPQNLDHRPDGI